MKLLDLRIYIAQRGIFLVATCRFDQGTDLET